jgi:hypothetical protein
MAEFPGSLPDEGFFLVNRIAPLQKRVFHKIGLPEEIKPFGPFHEEGNNIAFRFLFKNTIVFKGGIVENGKPMGTLPPFINQPPPVPPEGKAFLIRGKEAEATGSPPGKAPCRDTPPQVYYQGKIITRL